MSVFLFGDKIPSFELAKDRLEQVHGYQHKLRILLDELFILIGNSQP
jgi:hypothetical protein